VEGAGGAARQVLGGHRVLPARLQRHLLTIFGTFTDYAPRSFQWSDWALEWHKTVFSCGENVFVQSSRTYLLFIIILLVANQAN